ncbi:hypothetical protein, partial [Clostridioides difficile]
MKKIIVICILVLMLIIPTMGEIFIMVENIKLEGLEQNPTSCYISNPGIMGEAKCDAAYFIIAADFV